MNFATLNTFLKAKAVHCDSKFQLVIAASRDAEKAKACNRGGNRQIIFSHFVLLILF